MNEPSGLETAARALLAALEGLATALATARHDAIVESAGRLERHTQDFARAAAEGILEGHRVPAAILDAVSATMRRCQGLGSTFTVLEGTLTPALAPAYTPQGQISRPSSDVPRLTARG